MFPDTYKIEGYYGMWDVPEAYIQNMFILFPWDVKYKKSIVQQTMMKSCELGRFKQNYWTAAFAVLPYLFAKLGTTLVTAFPAPVEVITILIAAERPLRGFLYG